MGFCPGSYHRLLWHSGAVAVNRPDRQQLSQGKKGRIQRVRCSQTGPAVGRALQKQRERGSSGRVRKPRRTRWDLPGPLTLRRLSSRIIAYCLLLIVVGLALLECSVTVQGKGIYHRRIKLTFGFFFQTRSGAGWKRVLRSLCHSRTRVPLLAAIYFLMVHVLLVLCFTGHL